MRVAALVLSATLAGCAFAPLGTITQTAEDYNHAVERAKNQMLLLNIVRASDRRPMYFTTISGLRGNLQSQISTGNIPIPFGGNHNSIYSAGPSVNYTANPSFDVAVQESKAFWQGITTPVSPDTVRYYVEEGWPKEMLLFLLIRKLEIADVSFANYPGDPDEMAAFAAVLRSFFNCDDGPEQCDVHFASASPDAYGPPLAPADVTHLRALVDVEKEGLSLKTDPCDKQGRFRLTGKPKGLHLAGLFDVGTVATSLGSAKQRLCGARDALDGAPADLDAANVALRQVVTNLDTSFLALQRIATRLSQSERTLRLAVQNANTKITRGDVQERLQKWHALVQENRRAALVDLKPVTQQSLPKCGWTSDFPAELRKARDLLQKDPSKNALERTYSTLGCVRDALDTISQKLSAYCIGTAAGGSCNATAYFRSPEAILYYLGEVVREQPEHEVKVRYCPGTSTKSALFKVEKGAGDEQPSGVISVKYEDRVYSVKDEFQGKCSTNLATETLTLVAQLFAQQTDASQAPATGAVTIVGPLPPH